MRDPSLHADEVFVAALKLEGPERQAFLEKTCGPDAELLREVQSLLAAHEAAGGFMRTAASAGFEQAVMVEKSGDRIGRYRLLEVVGEGSFGVVWMAEQEDPVRRRVALKIIKLGMDTRQVTARFEAERQALAMMEHPGIARVFDGGATATGRPYFVMELVRGVPITEFCNRARLTTAERLRLFVEVCHAVQHAHQKGVIHRDLKPSNVLVMEQDGRPTPKVIDFGVARATEQRLTERTLFTRFGQVVGTPAYMSPEQAGLGGLDIDTRSDVYSLGVLLYELLTGHTPFDAGQLREIGYEALLRSIREEEPPKPSTRLSTLGDDELGAWAAQHRAEPARLSRAVRGELDWITMKALSKDRARRYDSANAMGEDVERFLNNVAVEAGPPSVAYRAQRFLQRHRVWAASAAIITVALVLATLLSVRWGIQANRAGQAAEKSAQQNRARLVQNYVANGTRLLEQGFYLNALVWFTEALRNERPSQAAENLHRIRVGSMLRHAPTLEQLWVCEGGPARLAFSRDGARVLMTSGRRVQVCQASTGQVLIRLDHTTNVLQASFSPDARQLLTTDASAQVHVWDLAAGREALAPLVHPRPVVAALWSDGGRRIITASFLASTNLSGLSESGEGAIRIYETATGREVRPELATRKPIVGLVASPDGRWLASGAGKTLVAWNLEDPSATVFPTASSDPIFVPGRGSDAAASTPELRLPDWPRARAYSSGRVEDPGVACFTFDPDSSRLLVAYADGSARVWNLPPGPPVVLAVDSLQRRPRDSRSLGWRHALFSPDSTHVLLVGTGDTVTVWDARNGRLLRQFPSHAMEAGTIGFSPDGRTVFDGWQLREVLTGEAVPPGLPGQFGAAFSPDGSRVVTAALSPNVVRLWNLANSAQAVPPMRHDWDLVHPPSQQPKQEVERVAVSQTAAHPARDANDRRIVDARDHGVTWLWDLTSGEAVAPPSIQRVVPLVLSTFTESGGAVFSADGRRLVTWSQNGSARVWEIPNGRPVSPYITLRGPVHGAAFSPDGRRLALVGATLLTPSTGTACVFDSSTGQALSDVLTHAQSLEAAEFSPDGRYLVVRGGDTAALWDLRGSTAAPVQGTEDLRAAAFSLQGHLSVTCQGSNRFVTRLQRGIDGRPPTTVLDEGDLPMVEMRFSPDGRWLAGLRAERVPEGAPERMRMLTVQLWDTATGKLVRPRSNARGALMRLVFSADSRLLVVLRFGQVPMVWDLAAQTELDPQPYRRLRSGLVDALSPDLSMAAIRDPEGIRVFDTVTGELLTPTFPGTEREGFDARSSVWSRDGRWFVTWANGMASLWSVGPVEGSREELLALSGLLSGFRLSVFADLESCTASDLERAWANLRARQPEWLRTTPLQIRLWRERQAELSERDQQWFAALFHLEQLLHETPQDPGLRARAAHARNRHAIEGFQ